MLKRPLTLLIAVSSALLAAEEKPVANFPPPAPAKTWTVSLQAGFANTFQMALGGTFGEGWNFQNKLTLSVNNALRKGDSVSLFGWSTTNLSTGAPNWQGGMLYKTRIFQRPRHGLILGGGVQRWLLPSVKTGAQDWLVSGNLNYTATVKRVPITVNQDSWSLLRSTLPLGSALCTQIYTQHRIWKHPKLQLSFRQGPHHTYAWGFYGAQGNRVVRYGASLVATWKGNTIEAGYRHQFALQDRIPNNNYWSFLVTRQVTRPLHTL